MGHNGLLISASLSRAPRAAIKGHRVLTALRNRPVPRYLGIRFRLACKVEHRGQIFFASG
jgi:hypothetical protein